MEANEYKLDELEALYENSRLTLSITIFVLGILVGFLYYSPWRGFTLAIICAVCYVVVVRLSDFNKSIRHQLYSLHREYDGQKAERLETYLRKNYFLKISVGRFLY